jgi:probable rRNA maturation factor
LALLFTFGENLKTHRSQGTAAENAEKSLVTFKKRIPNLTESTVARFVARAKRAARVRGEVNVMITSSSELRRLNRRFRGKNKTTDVLSFPSTAIPANGLAGDVAISADIAADNARRLGHSMAEEIKILALHGILHLAGYDHERDHGQMASREARLRKAFRLPVGLIERNGKPLNAEHAENSRRSWRKASVQRSSK